MGFVNFNCFYISSRYRIGVNGPRVIQVDFLCFYLLNCFNLLDLCIVLLRVICLYIISQLQSGACY